MYDPRVGRFLSEDPIGFEGRDENLYRYVANGVTMATDPHGLITWITTDQKLLDAKRELEGSESGRALLDAISNLEQSKKVEVRVRDAVQSLREHAGGPAWEAMKPEEQEKRLRESAGRSRTTGCIKDKATGKLVIDVTINVGQSTPGDPGQSWYPTGPNRTDVRFWAKLSENLFHELVHALLALKGQDTIKDPPADVLGCQSLKEWKDRWGNIVEYNVIEYMKDSYYPESGITPPWAYAATAEQEEYAKEELARRNAAR